MRWPEVLDKRTGIRRPFTDLTPSELSIYLRASQWASGHGTREGSSIDVRKMIAARLLAGAV